MEFLYIINNNNKFLSPYPGGSNDDLLIVPHGVLGPERALSLLLAIPPPPYLLASAASLPYPRRPGTGSPQAPRHPGSRTPTMLPTEPSSQADALKGWYIYDNLLRRPILALEMRPTAILQGCGNQRCMLSWPARAAFKCYG